MEQISLLLPLTDGGTEAQNSVTARGGDQAQAQSAFVQTPIFSTRTVDYLSCIFSDFLLTGGTKYLMSFIKLLKNSKTHIYPVKTSSIFQQTSFLQPSNRYYFFPAACRVFHSFRIALDSFALDPFPQIH